MTTGQIELLSKGVGGATPDASCVRPSVSTDGHRVIFESSATNLVPNDDNNSNDVFVYDRTHDVTLRISENPSGMGVNDVAFAEAISEDGRFVAFSTFATNIPGGELNGRILDLFIRDLQAGTTRLVSVGVDGVAADGGSGLGASLSADGRYCAFVSAATNLVTRNSRHTGR